MKILRELSNALVVIGIILSLIGLVYNLGFVDSVFFQYCFSIGIILLGIGVLFSVFDKKKPKKKV